MHGLYFNQKNKYFINTEKLYTQNKVRADSEAQGAIIMYTETNNKSQWGTHRTEQKI